MNNRERAMNMLHYKPVDRCPAVHFAYWQELLDEWAAQGHIPARIAEGYYDGCPAEKELDAIIGWDFNWQGCMAGAANGLRPAFEHKVLEVLPDGCRRIQNHNGIIERIKPGVQSIPSEDDYQLKDRKAFEELYLPRMQYAAERVDLEHFRKLKDAPRERPLGLHLGSIMGNIRDMTSVMGMSYLMYDEDEELFADIVDAWADMQYKCVEAILATGIQFDFAHYWEDICFKNGPLLSPAKFDELCARHYKKRNDLCRAHGIDVISLDCDGVTDKLQATWLENGVNTLFPIEVGVWGDQFAPARERFGKAQLGVGGMDKIAFRKDRAAVDAEIERMQKLTLMGGFIPCPDHRLMPGSKFELVQYYAEEIKKIRTYG